MMRHSCTSRTIVDIIKCLLIFTCGYIVKSLVDIPPATVCPRCPGCEVKLKSTVLQDGRRHVDPKTSDESSTPPPISSYIPRTMYEVLRYDYMDTKHLYNNIDDDPRIGLLGHHRQDVEQIVSAAEEHRMSGGGGDDAGRGSQPWPWQVTKLLNVYRRLDPTVGEEYVLDVTIAAENLAQVEERRRYTMMKPFGDVRVVSSVVLDEPSMIHFILPMYKVNHRFKRFMENFEEVCLKSKQHVYLMIIMFTSETSEGDAEVAQVKQITKGLSLRYKNGHIRIIQTYKPFSRALGIDLGTKQLPQEALMFFCDIDVLLSRQFMERCQLNAVSKKQVYYPMVFAQYKPSIVKKFSPPEMAANLTSINKYTGHWVHYGFGMVCLYNVDYQVVHGYNTSISGWGGEDVQLYKKHVKSKLKVFRAAEPGLIHIYHDKTCEDHLDPEQTKMCAGSQAEGIGSKQQLGKYIVDLGAT